MSVEHRVKARGKKELYLGCEEIYMMEMYGTFPGLSGHAEEIVRLIWHLRLILSYESRS